MSGFGNYLVSGLIGAIVVVVVLTPTVFVTDPDPNCEEGEFVLPNGNCAACERGKFSDGVTCEFCPPGRFAGARCEACSPGFFTDGESPCSACPAGRFARTEGMRGCEPCPPFGAQPLPGQTACECVLPCFAGAACQFDPACECPVGSASNGTACEDVDECQTLAPCDGNATCTNTLFALGGFNCSCNPGFVDSVATTSTPGVVCLRDLDGDRIGGWEDNCPLEFNPAQTTFPGTSVGEACALDLSVAKFVSGSVVAAGALESFVVVVRVNASAYVLDSVAGVVTLWDRYEHEHLRGAMFNPDWEPQSPSLAPSALEVVGTHVEVTWEIPFDALPLAITYQLEIDTDATDADVLNTQVSVYHNDSRFQDVLPANNFATTQTELVDRDECALGLDSCSFPEQECLNTQGSFLCPCSPGRVDLEGRCTGILPPDAEDGHLFRWVFVTKEVISAESPDFKDYSIMVQKDFANSHAWEVVLEMMNRRLLAISDAEPEGPPEDLMTQVIAETKTEFSYESSLKQGVGLNPDERAFIGLYNLRGEFLTDTTGSYDDPRFEVANAVQYASNCLQAESKTVWTGLNRVDFLGARRSATFGLAFSEDALQMPFMAYQEDIRNELPLYGMTRVFKLRGCGDSRCTCSGTFSTGFTCR